MDTSKKPIELLAPARTAEIGIAAVNSGADAVYIAAEKFGAREGAGNTLRDIEKLIAHAHKYYAKVYVALNTILTDYELEEAVGLINSVYSIGADGIIIQDMGLLECNLPPIPLIASTQMNTDSPEKAIFLEKIGFKRVILPREFTLDEIKKVSAATRIELECFIHGALCVSYSGQCYLSYAIGQRSSNRGECAQPCRRPYSLSDKSGNFLAKNRYLLSLKDLSRADHLKELIDAGVSSFKIEGRLKDLAYVINTVSFYRKKLDSLFKGKNLTKSSSGMTFCDFTPDLNKTFNRGYTAYFLDEKKENIASIYTPKSLGEKIGIVKKVEGEYFTLPAGHGLTNGDGICFYDSVNVLRGTLLNKVDGEKIYPDKLHYIKEKTIIYRNFDRAFIKTLEAKPCRRKIAVSFTLKEYTEGFSLEARDEDKNTAVFFLPAKKIKAEKIALAEGAVKNQLSKLNDTIFERESITSNLNDVYLIPLSLLNNLRRGAVDNLLIEREKTRVEPRGGVILNNIPYPLNSLDHLANCLNKKAVAFYSRHGAMVTEMAAESGLNMERRRLCITKYCVKKELGLCGKNSGELYLTDEDGQKYLLKFDCKKCQMEVFFLPLDDRE